MRRIASYFQLSHGIARVDNRRIVSAIVFVIKIGLRWRDYGPRKTIYNRFIRWSLIQQDFRRVGARAPKQSGS